VSDSPAELPAEVRRYVEATERPLDGQLRVPSLRFAVIDTEASGTDLRKDRIITIGGIAVKDGAILLDDGFEALLKMPYNTASVFIHGITAEEAAKKGIDEPVALAGFLDWLRDGVIVGHHIGFDLALLGDACQRHFGIEFKNPSIDTMELALHLKDAGAFAEAEAIQGFSLDALCAFFGVTPHDRHTAQGDAFLTAQIFLKLLKLARRYDRTTLGQLTEAYEAESER